MKLRAGFVSNSSTASFVVKTKPTEWDRTMKRLSSEELDAMTLSQEKIDLLKKCGFVPTTEENPFRREMNLSLGDYAVKPDTEDDALLGFWLTCNHLEVMEFLVANDIPFKATAHYGHYLYSYEPKDEHVYVLQNFGIEFMNKPKELEEIMEDPEENRWRNDLKPLRKIDKKSFLRNYDDETSKRLIKDAEWKDTE